MMSADGADVVWRQWLQTTERSSVTIGFPPARQGRSGLGMEAQREADRALASFPLSPIALDRKTQPLCLVEN